MVPVWRRGGVVESVERVVMGQVGGAEGGKLVDEEGFGVGGCFDGLVRKDCALVCIISKDTRDFHVFAGGERADRIVGDEVVVEDRVVGEYWRFGGIWERFVEVGGLEGGDGERAEAS